MRYALSLFLLAFLLSSISLPAKAQKVIEGTIRDAETGETLPSTNIIIKDAYRGTITNRDGTYSLSIPDSLLPATVQVRYIGYTSTERQITRNSERQQNFELAPSVGKLGEIVVTDEDPGMRIMRAVIEHKQQWRSQLKTFEAEAYTRQNVSNDTSLVLVNEAVSNIYWDKQQGAKEVITWRKQTKNISSDQNFAGVRYLANFYDDNVDIGGFDVVGITNPDAFSYYSFELIERLTMDEQLVYRLKVIPKRKLQPLFEGEAYVLEADSALIEVQLQPNSVVRFPPPVQSSSFSYQQQFNNFGGDFWLPVDARVTGSIKIGVPGLSFPELKVRQLSRITNYAVNVSLPDSLYDEENSDDVIVNQDAADSTTIAAIDSIERVPLSAEEEQAYAELDSTQTLDKVFQPTGFLSRFVDFSVNNDEDENRESGRGDMGSPESGFKLNAGLSPLIRYNRVDALFLGLKKEVPLFDDTRISGNAGYSLGYDDWSYGGEITHELSASRIRSTFGVSYQARTVPRYESQILRPLFTSVSNLLGVTDYYDYFRSEGVRFSAGITDTRTDIGLNASFNIMEHRSLQTETGYDILGRDNQPRINPAIDEGRMNSVGISAGYNLDEGYSFGIVGRKRIEFNAVVSDDALGSDFNFTRYSGHIDWSFDTFYKRRLFANTLNVSLDAGTFSGDLPYQSFGIVDGTPGIISLFEGLRTKRFRPYEGEQYAAVNLEHNFRTVPFERLGLTYLVEQNIGLLIFAGAAKTWVSDQRSRQIFNRTGIFPHTTDGTHLETGISVNGVLDLFRVDFAMRLDEPAFLVGVGITRFL